MSGNPSRDELVREADEARANLANRIEQLSRRPTLQRARLLLRPNLRQLAVIGALFVMVAGSAVAMTLQREASAARLRQGRWRLAKYMWRHPDRMVKNESSPFLKELAKRLAQSIVLLAAGSLASTLRKRSANSRAR